MIKRKYIVLSLLTLISIMLGGLLYSSIVSAQNSTVTSYVSVSAAAFMPVYPLNESIMITSMITHNLANDVYFAGSVQLPHGSTVTNMTFYYYDGVTPDLNCTLFRYHHTQQDGPPHLMSSANSSGTPGWSSSYDDTIAYATIDNSQYTYGLVVNVPPQEPNGDRYARFQYAVIEYTLPSGAGVGGLWIPVDKFGLLAPYIALVSIIILAVSVSVAYIKYRKKQ